MSDSSPDDPDFAAAGAAFIEFCRTIAALRHPVNGCPWDLQQDHASLRRYMIEEAYEAADAMAVGQPKDIAEELGDVLLQVVLNAQIALDGQNFSIVEVIRGIDEKMRRRHPHVFARAEEASALSANEVRAAWDQIKANEKGMKENPVSSEATPVFAEAEKTTPATLQAAKIGKLAAKIGFDWDQPKDVYGQVQSEMEELAQELNDPAAPKSRIADELGDVYFSLAQLARHLQLDPEVVAVDANRKFLGRFRQVEALAAAKNINVRATTRDQLEALWQAAKRSPGG